MTYGGSYIRLANQSSSTLRSPFIRNRTFREPRAIPEGAQLSAEMFLALFNGSRITNIVIRPMHSEKKDTSITFIKMSSKTLYVNFSGKSER